ncbi:MAG: 50S ribosomal protein L11 methyltransferase [Lachnospiraceae bacterium]
MKWNRFRIKTNTQAEDMIAYTLAELGIEGVQIEDAIPLTEEEKEQMFVDIMPEPVQDEGIAYVSFYLEEGVDTRPILQRVQEELHALSQVMEIGPATIEATQTQDKDWVNNWKEFFHQFYIDDILVTPSWEKVSEEDADKLVLHIDPGTAFGTGLHETTQLCVRQLKKYCTPGAQMLDIGTGSGILGLIALKLGAGHVLGTDLDPCALAAVKENIISNSVSEAQFDMHIGNLINDKEVQDIVGYGRYDLVTANILADVLVALMPAAAVTLAAGGHLIASGILLEKETEVAQAIETEGLQIVETTYQNEWVSITAQKN